MGDIELFWVDDRFCQSLRVAEIEVSSISATLNDPVVNVIKMTIGLFPYSRCGSLTVFKL